MDIKKLDQDAALKPLAPVTPARPASPVGSPGEEGAVPTGAAGDRVEISDQARARADEAGEAVDCIPTGTMSPEQLLELRRRIQARVHDSPEVIRVVAQRIIESGDL
jgi:hypothetical protein